jgi:hypothetical protein
LSAPPTRAPMMAPSSTPGASSLSSQPSSASHGLLPDLSWDPRLRRVSLRSRVLSFFLLAVPLDAPHDAAVGSTANSTSFGCFRCD